MLIRIAQCIICFTFMPASGYRSKYPNGYSEFSGNRETLNTHRRSDGSYTYSYTANARSIEFSSTIQRIQDTELRRLGPSQRLENTEQPAFRDGIVFPGPTKPTTKRTFIPEITEECKTMGICEDIPNYPEDFVAEILPSIDQSKFTIDEFSLPDVFNRMGSPDDIELCSFSERIIHPKAAPDKDGKWYYIINQATKPLQGIKVEVCAGDNMSCSKLAHFRSGYEGKCRQKYTLRVMTGLNETGNPVDRPFKVPSCCSCIIKLIE